MHARFHAWLQTPPGIYLQAWQRVEFDRAVVDIFGYHALQLGLPQLHTLEANRMPHAWLALDDAAELPQAVLTERTALLTDFEALPFPEASLDLVTLPHTLELSGDPHGALREVQRVLVPEGRVVICGLNPVSLWGLRQRRGQLYQRFGWGEPYVPDAVEWIGHRRLRDWLRLLSFEVESVRFGCYRPAVAGLPWLERTAWMDRLGPRWWSIFGGMYFVVAVKRVRGIKLMGRSWKSSTIRAAAPVPVAKSAHSTGAETRKYIDFD